MEYSKRLGELTDEQLQRALDRFKLGQLLKAESIPFGNFGQNIFLTSTMGEFVLRGKPHYSWQFGSEATSVNLLHDKTSVPVPFPYLIDESNEIFGWSYVIMPRLPGHQFNHQIEANLPNPDRIEIAQALGENLAEMHKLTWGFAGKYSQDSSKIEPFSISFPDWVVENIRSLLDTCCSINGRTSVQDKEWVEEILDKNAGALKIAFKPTFVMQDYQITNVTMLKINEEWKVSGVFDFMESYFGDGEADLSRTCANYIERHSEELGFTFINAYFSITKRRQGFENRFPIYMLLDRLIVWEWAQRTNHLWWETTLSFRDWAKKFVNFREN